MDRHTWLLIPGLVALVGCSGGAGASDAASDVPIDISDARHALDAAEVPDGRVVRLRLLEINDLHGNLRAPTGTVLQVPDGGTVAVGGVAVMATYLRELRAASPHNLFVSSGDLIGGSPLLSGYFHDEPTIEVMNEMGLDYNAVGNHEFDEGLGELRRMQMGGCHPTDGCLGAMPFRGARFRFLAANVSETGMATTIFPRYEVREFEGVKVAVVGMTLRDTPRAVPASGVAGLEFASETATVNALVPELRRMGVEAIVVLVHQGGSVSPSSSPLTGCANLTGAIVEIAQGLDNAVDVVASAHTHSAYICRVGGKLVTSAGALGQLVTVTDLGLDPATGDVVSARAENIAMVNTVTPDPAVAAIVARYEGLSRSIEARPFGTITATLGRAASPAGQTSLGSVVTDAQLAATRSAGAVVAFQQNGGLRADLEFARSGGETTDGQVTFGEAFAVQPFGNGLRTATLSGAQIKAILEMQFEPGQRSFLQVSQGFSYVWDRGAPVGARVDPASIQIGGRPMDLAASYRVTFNETMLSSYPIFTQGTDVVIGPVDIDALAAYFRENSPVAPPSLDRILLL
jgi:5'-nucleotidase